MNTKFNIIKVFTKDYRRLPIYQNIKVIIIALGKRSKIEIGRVNKYIIIRKLNSILNKFTKVKFNSKGIFIANIKILYILEPNIQAIIIIFKNQAVRSNRKEMVNFNVDFINIIPNFQKSVIYT